MFTLLIACCSWIVVTNLSSSGSSSSSETSSESESSSDSDTGHDEFDKIIEDTSKGNQERNKNKKHQRKNNIRKVGMEKFLISLVP